jgi:hypothetical protein
MGRRAALLATLKRENERLKQETLAKLKEENKKLQSQSQVSTSADDDDDSDDDEDSSSSSSGSSSNEDSNSSDDQSTQPAPVSNAAPPPAGEPDDDGLLAFIKTKRSFWLKYLRANNLAEVGNDPSRHSEATRRGFWREQSGAAVTASSSNKRAAEPAPAPATKKQKPAPEKLPPKKFAGVGIDVSVYSVAAELLQAHGADALKAELQRLGLKCGGKPIDRAERLLASGGRSADELNSSFLLQNAPATKSVLPSDAVRRRNELQKKKRDSGASSTKEVENQDQSDDGGASSDDSSDDDVVEKPLPAAKAAGATPKVSDEAVLEIVKNNRASWLRWIKKHDLEKTGKDPTRHTPATRRKFYKDPHAKKVLPGQPAKPATVAPAKKEPKSAAKKEANASMKRTATSIPVSPAGAPSKRNSKMSVILARARDYGVEQAELDAAMDAADPREAVVRYSCDCTFATHKAIMLDPMMKF